MITLHRTTLPTGTVNFHDAAGRYRGSLWEDDGYWRFTSADGSHDGPRRVTAEMANRDLHTYLLNYEK